VWIRIEEAVKELLDDRPPGDENRELAVKNRDITAAKMTPAQIAEAEKRAQQWKLKREGQE
jgi:hypothetical protein